MRFLADGPSIPDDLLVARDQGRVVFFCGAGVSRARANLADFLGLTRAVAEKLAIAPESAIRELIAAFPALPTIKGLGSLVSADRVFSLMEREFATKDIYNAIANSLRPASNVDLSAHSSLLDLAKGPSGQVRLVTTNFDLLFEACDPSLPKWKPPRLPDPLRSDEFEGIVHLHGYVTDDYVDAAGDGLVISSAEFGRAYLSERWATDFIRAVLEKYVVVFVGYAADDPPMQYLLEGLSRRAGNSTEAYAFQAGSLEEGQARWTQKGVRVVSYPESRDHAALWSTLEAWAKRARNPEAWYDQTIALGQNGPEGLLPHERGRVAHVVSTLEGAKRFGIADPVPPASWLCCFDPLVRFALPGRTGTILERGDYFDPFDAYGLDSDAVPARINPDDPFAKRDVPPDAWSCFALTRKDREDAREDAFAGLRGYYAVHSPSLTPRLSWLGNWLVRVSGQPASVWWAIKQSGIHSALQQQIRDVQAFDEKEKIVRIAWRYLFESWLHVQNDFHQEWYSLLNAVKQEGWTEGVARRLIDLHTPYVSVGQAFSGSPRAPDNQDEVALRDLLHLDVEYPHSDEPIVIPDDKVQYVLRGFCKKLELGVALEAEIGGYGLYNFDSIGVSKKGDPSLRQGISAPVFKIANLFSRLVKYDVVAAKREALNWKPNDPVFSRLLIWAYGDARIFSAAEAGSFFVSLSESDFWDGGHQADLLLSLSSRWSELPSSRRRNIERRLLRGRSRWTNESKGDFVQSRSSLSLTRIFWLKARGCKFEVALDTDLAKLRSRAPQWMEEYADTGVQPSGMQSGWVRKDTNSSELDDTPLNAVLQKAAELAERRATFFVERDPFSGLVATKPIRALRAISAAQKQGRYYPWAWQSFLSSERRSQDSLRLITLIATRLSRLPEAELLNVVRPVCSWMQNVSKLLLLANRSAFQTLWCRVLEALKSSDEVGRSGLVRSTDRARDWATEALNSAAGSLSQAILNDPDLDAKKLSGKLPTWWVSRARELLELKGDPHLHSITLFSHQVVWLFQIDPLWTKSSLLRALELGGDDASAFWAGLFWAGRLPSLDLYLSLKPAMLGLAKNQGSIDRREHAEQLAAMLLAGWGGKLPNGERAVTDEEMRSVLLGADDDLRSQIIWCLEMWSSEEGGTWADDALVLLEAVWPRQLIARTARVSSRLCNLAFSQNEKFPQFVDKVVPLITKVEQDQLHLPMFKPSESSVFERYPEKVLKLLSAALPDDARKWPYGMGDVLSRVEKADPALKSDSRWIDLKRIWDSR